MPRNPSVYLIAIIAIALSTFAASAQELSLEKISEIRSKKIDPQANRLVTSPNAACNRGEEPFSKFLEKFNSSVLFRASRLRKAPEENDNQYDMLQTLCSPKEIGKRPEPIIESGDTQYTVSSFWDVRADSVLYTTILKPDGDCDGGLITTAWFRRIDGKWYCVAGHYNLG